MIKGIDANDIPTYEPLNTSAVKPLKPLTVHKPIIAVNHLGAMTEDGEVLTHKEFTERLDEFESSYIIGYSATTLLYKLHRHWGKHPLWQWRVNETENTGMQSITVSYFGFRRPNGHKRSRLHYVVDYASFFRSHEDIPTLPQMVETGKQLREFCKDMGIRVKGTAAGTMAQLLRHPRFYPNPRRRVPVFINEEARKHLPGNHYGLYTDPGQKIEAAVYIDQAAAHHHAVSVTPLPDANTLTCQGYDKTNRTYARYTTNPESLYQIAIKQHGLFRLRVHIPHTAHGKWSLPWIDKLGYGSHIVHVWSNEIPYMQSLGVKIEAIIAVWGTEDVDKGLPRYARFALDVQNRYPWLKTALLTVYGSLALNAHALRIHYHKGGGRRDTANLGPMIVDTHSVGLKPRSLTTNVVQRGLIEAHVRALSLDMARKCHEQDIEVMSIYADGIFLRTKVGKQLPLIHPWRQKEEVTELEYECATRFRSNELSRLPGTPRFNRNYMEVQPHGNV